MQPSEPITFYFAETPEIVEPTVTSGHLVVWSGEPGPAASMPVGMITEGDGTVHVVQMGDVEQITVTDVTYHA